jgi:hypothetical protein
MLSTLFERPKKSHGIASKLAPTGDEAAGVEPGLSGF